VVLHVQLAHSVQKFGEKNDMQKSSCSHANNLRTAFSGIKKEGTTRTRISNAIIMPIDIEKKMCIEVYQFLKNSH